VSGLTAGTAYTFKVQASNAAGAGPVSASSNAVTPTTTTVPGAPTGVTATATVGGAKVTWSAPASNGGSAITGSTITPYAGVTAQTALAVTVAGTATTGTITGLTSGTAYTFKVKSTNAIGTGAESAASAALKPAMTLFNSRIPAIDSVSNDPNAVELGTKIKSDVAGTITALRFYKGAGNSGTHVGNVWSTTGTKLASVTFTGESASGWQEQALATPLAITAGTTYVVSYFAPAGHYAATENAFNTAFDNAPLHAPATATSPNGVYAYTASSVFPANTYLATDYGVDVVFAPQ